jgi:3',5'-cyclic-AMP phosphodiesterase
VEVYPGHFLESSGQMRFVLLGDLHYSQYPSKKLSAIRDEFFFYLFQAVKKTQPDVVFALGDLTHGSHAEELENVRTIAARAGITHYYMLNGNHDLLRLTRHEIIRYNYNPLPGYFALHLDEHGQESSDGSTFLLLDTARQGQYRKPSGYLDSAQLKWLAHELSQIPTTQPAIVLAHHPLRGLTTWANFSGMHLTNSKEAWHVLSQHPGPGFYFCGHGHINSQDRQGRWRFIQTGAPLLNLNFRVVDLTPQGLQTRLVEIEGAREVSGLAGLLSLRFTMPHFDLLLQK